MLFWPIALIIAVILAGMTLASGEYVLPTNQLSTTESIVAGAVLFALGLAGIGRVLVRDWGRRLMNAMMAGIAVAAIGGGYAYRTEAMQAWTLVRGELMPSVATTRAPGVVELRRGWDGHYRAQAEINGQAIVMMVDTGASMVLIPYEAAEAMGLRPDQLRFSLPVITANGESSVAPVRLASVEIGDIMVQDVVAAVARPGMLKSALLGMSFLERLSETIFRGDRLILRIASEEYDDTVWLAGRRG